MELSIPLCINGRGCCFPAVRLGGYLQSHGGMLLDHNTETESQREESRESSTGCATQHRSSLINGYFLLIALSEVVRLEFNFII